MTATQPRPLYAGPLEAFVVTDRGELMPCGTQTLESVLLNPALASSDTVGRYPDTPDVPADLRGLYTHLAWWLLPAPAPHRPSLTLADEDLIDKALCEHGYDGVSTKNDPLPTRARLLDLCATFDGIEFADSDVRYPEWRHLEDAVLHATGFDEAYRQVWLRAGSSDNARQALRAYQSRFDSETD